MTNFKSIPEWLKSSPSENEVKKVLALINKGAANETRRQVYDLQRYLNNSNTLNTICFQTLR